jgi:hypothetical protein
MSNSVDITANVTNLVPDDTYIYTFKGAGSNWPTIVTPISGTFTANSETANIDSLVYFCLTKTSCNSSSSEYMPCTDSICTVGDKYFAKVKLNFYNTKAPSHIYESETIRVEFSGELPKGKITPDSSGLFRDKMAPIQLEFINLPKDRTYQYSISSLSANWPFAVTAPSGFFNSASGSGTAKIEVGGGFCESTGVCQNNQYGVLTYSIPNLPKPSWYKPEIAFRVSFFDIDYPSIIHYTNIAKYNCYDCVDRPVGVSVGVNNIKDCQS